MSFSNKSVPTDFGCNWKQHETKTSVTVRTERYTKLKEAIPTHETNGTAAAKLILKHAVPSFSISSDVLTETSPNSFCNPLWLYEASSQWISPLRPSSNRKIGEAKHFKTTVVSGLRHWLSEPKTDMIATFYR